MTESDETYQIRIELSRLRNRLRYNPKGTPNYESIKEEIAKLEEYLESL